MSFLWRFGKVLDLLELQAELAKILGPVPSIEPTIPARVDMGLDVSIAARMSAYGVRSARKAVSARGIISTAPPC